VQRKLHRIIFSTKMRSAVMVASTVRVPLLSAEPQTTIWSLARKTVKLVAVSTILLPVMSVTSRNPVSPNSGTYSNTSPARRYRS
jgi:hypothetical protein